MSYLEQRWILTLAGMVLLGPTLDRAQRPPAPQTAAVAHSAQGSLTVTLTVASSVGVVTGTDGEQHLVLANAADPADNVSHIQYVQLSPAGTQEPQKTAVTKKKPKSGTRAKSSRVPSSTGTK